MHISIIVIAFNEERRIEACLRALLTQDAVAEYEVIVVDDASRDSTARIVEEMIPDFVNLRLVRHEANRGRGAARRTGQDATDAPWIGFVDADIIVPTNWLSRCLEELSDVDGVSGIAQPDGDCAVIWRLCQPMIRQRSGSAEITGNNVLFSRDALKKFPFSPTARLGEDFRLAKSMVRGGLRLRTVEQLRVEHRETKSYAQGVKWMWQSGFDATSLLLEFRRVRTPDLAWLTWLAVTLLSAVGAIFRLCGMWVVLFTSLATALLIDAMFIYSRFLPRPRTSRFLGALVISPPMMLSYLVGRTAGLWNVPTLLRRHPRRKSDD